MLFNAGSIGLLLAYINARFDGMNESINRRFDAIDQRFEDIRDLGAASFIASGRCSTPA
jgi:hypothetical protein